MGRRFQGPKRSSAESCQMSLHPLSGSGSLFCQPGPSLCPVVPGSCPSPSFWFCLHFQDLGPCSALNPSLLNDFQPRLNLSGHRSSQLALAEMDLAQEFPGGEMGGGSGMRWHLRAPGERVPPSQHPTCPQGPGLHTTKERLLLQGTEQQRSQPCPAPHLLLRPGQPLRTT